MEIPQEKEENTIDLQCILLYKGLKGKASIPTDGLSHPSNPPNPPPKKKKLDEAEISTLWHFRLPLLIQMFIKVVYPHPPQTIGDGMPAPIL